MSAMFDKVMLRWPDREHWAGCFRNNLFRRRTEQRAGQAATAMGHHRHQIDVIVAHRCGYLVRRFALDNDRFDFQSIKERIGEQLFDLTAKLAEPLRLFILDRKSTRLNSSHEWISYAVFCLKKKKKK